MAIDARVLDLPAVSVAQAGDIHVEADVPHGGQQTVVLRFSQAEAFKLATALLQAAPPVHYWATPSWADRITELETRLDELERAK